MNYDNRAESERSGSVCTGGRPGGKGSFARKAVASLMRATKSPEIDITTEAEDVIHQLLLELGAPPNLLGYKFAVYGILYAAMNPDAIDNFYWQFYPDIAKKFNTTASRVERAIRHLIDQTWLYGDMDAQTKYFSSTATFKSGRPTNKHFVARCVLIVRSRLKK